MNIYEVDIYLSSTFFGLLINFFFIGMAFVIETFREVAHLAGIPFQIS